MLPKEIFISHSSQDQAFAAHVAETLRRHGLSVWYSPTNLIGSQPWQDEIGAALDRCDWFLVLLSPCSLESMWVRRELNYALAEVRLIGKIVPLRHAPCQEKELSWVLPQLQIVDFTASHDAGFAQLLRVWGIGYQGQP